MTETIKNIVLTTVIFLGIDSIWLGIISKNLYDKWLSPFERQTNIFAAVIVYIFLPLGIAIFVLPRIEKGNALQTIGFGALYGAIVYAVYDFTNLATLKNWSLQMSIVDVLWGSFLSAITTLIVTQIIK